LTAALNKDDLHLTRLASSATIVTPPPAPATPGGPINLAARALSARDSSAIYGEIARYGFSSFQMVPGGAQMASGDGVTTLTLTGTGWGFVEDLSRSVFEQAADKLAVSVGLLVQSLPEGTFMFNHLVDLHAVWDNIGESTDSYISKRFLQPQAEQVVTGLPGGLVFNGGAIRLGLARPSDTSLPPGVSIAGGSATPMDSVDVRIEPFYADKSKLYLQVTGTFILTTDPRALSERLQFVRSILWDHVAGNMTLES